jgi:hypothetical protein
MPVIGGFEKAVKVPAETLAREIDGELVIISVTQETYFGLDEVGTRIWQLLTTSPRIQDAFDTLLDEFDVDSETLAGDLGRLVGELEAHGLIKLVDA